MSWSSGDIYKTHWEWMRLNREVLKKSLPHGWTWDNRALYTIDQTKEIKK